MFRGVYVVLVALCLCGLVGCGINITLPGSGTPACSGPGCEPGQGSTTGGVSTPSTPGENGRKTKPVSPNPPSAPGTKCDFDASCRPGERCLEQRCEELSCDSLRRDVCLKVRGRCFLEWRAPGEYNCRPAANACEKRDQNSCQQASDCRWDKAQCYCPAGMNCYCAGGPAANCTESPCKGVVGCSKYCMDTFQCCATYGMCDDIWPGCNLRKPAPQICLRPPPCYTLSKAECDSVSKFCRWKGTSGQGSCAEK